jgi:hypothetical protein
MPRGDEEETASRPPRRLHGSPAVPWACRTAVGARLRLELALQPPTSAPDMPAPACPPGGLPPCGEGQPRCHGPGAEGAWPTALPARSLAAGALPQPDRLGHLLSRARGDAGWIGRRARLPIALGAPQRLVKSSEDEFAGRACLRELAAGCPACAGLSGPEADVRRSRGVMELEPRAASPGPSRKVPGSAAPEVPSIDGLL